MALFRCASGWLAMVAVIGASLLLSAQGLAEELRGGYPVLTYQTHWLGNTFPGVGSHGQGEWVQNHMEALHVTPDGVAIAVTHWDEAGRCIGLYRAGRTNHQVLKQYDGRGGHKAWGWGTASRCVSADEQHVYVVNTEGTLLRFRWSPPDINSARYDTELDGVGKAHALDVRGNHLVIVTHEGQVQIRNRRTLELDSHFKLANARDVIITPQATLWLLVGERIVQRNMSGEPLPGEIVDAGQPSAIALAPDGQLLVADNGPRQQVLFYELGTEPRLVKTFGQQGGIAAGQPGVVENDKLWGLTGVGMDRQGHLYVSSDLGGGGGGVMLRVFSPKGDLLWKVESHAFLDTYGVDPASDGRVIYGVDEIFDFDPQQKPGNNWSLKAITLDRHANPADPRLKPRGFRTSSAFLRRPEGRRLLFTIGQTSSGFELFTFGNTEQHLATHVMSVGKGGWPWFVDEKAGIWFGGDDKNRKIQHFPFRGWDGAGKPIYDLQNPRQWDWPAGFTKIARVLYRPDTDTLFVSGYTPDLPMASWGLIGSVIVRYDQWSTHQRREVWRTRELPRDDEGFHPKSIDLAGDYLFTVTTRKYQGKDACVLVWHQGTGRVVGAMVPTSNVGGQSGWVDISHGIQAFKRENGQYMVIVEEDARAKNLLYLWKP